MTQEQNRLQAIAQTASNDADVDALVYGEVYQSRFTASVEAMRNKTINAVVKQHTGTSNAIIAQVLEAYVEDAEINEVAVIIPKAIKASFDTEPIDVNTSHLMPKEKPVRKLKAA
jgi:hypothetical protein